MVVYTVLGMHANLAMNDRLDGKMDWPLGPDGAHPLTELLLADYLVVDVSQSRTPMTASSRSSRRLSMAMPTKRVVAGH